MTRSNGSHARTDRSSDSIDLHIDDLPSHDRSREELDALRGGVESGLAAMPTLILADMWTSLLRDE